VETVLSLPSARLGGYRLLEDRPRILKRELLIDNGTNFRDFSECALMQKENRSARGTSEPCFMGCPGLLGTTEEVFSMCDYSLQHVKSRPAKVGDKLTTHHFNTGTIGFAAPEDANTAVCVLPGTELAFARAVTCQPRGLFGWKADTINHTTAIFRQINKHKPLTHHDALEFPDGQTVRLTDLFEGQEATVLQLPAQPATAAEAKAQERVAYVG
jgi:hypothetical protein